MTFRPEARTVKVQVRHSADCKDRDRGASLLTPRHTSLGQIVLKLDGGPLNGQFFGERYSDYVLTQQVH